MARIFIGTSGWAYGSWKGCFYPPGLPDVQRLGFYSHRFRTTEVNFTYYQVPSEQTYRKWATLVPPDFVFAIKANRMITHVGRLQDVRTEWQAFIRGVRQLGPAAGPVLVQLPPSFPVNIGRLVAFLAMASEESSGVRLVFEFRHPSWFTAVTYRVLTRHQAALCIADGVRHHRCNVLTTDFSYFRYHGRTPKEAPFYREEELIEEARLIERFGQEGIDSYVYFNNDADGHAPVNARRLSELLAADRQAA
jgi:uncharacterized protein YecE (DUF72 family)